MSTGACSTDGDLDAMGPPPGGGSGPSRGPLKVCLASMAPFVGGAEVAAERLALGLRTAGHEVVLVLGRRGAVMERMERAGLRCLCSPMYFTDKWHWWRYVSARGRLRRLLKRERPDVLHSNDLPTHQIASDAARGLGMPRICHHRFPFDGAAIDWLNKHGAERHLFVSGALMAEMCGRSDRLTACPRSVVHDGLPLPPEPTPAEKQRARAQVGLPEGRVIVLFVGQVIELKGVADLIRAWSLLDAGAATAAELVIVGDDLQRGGGYRVAMQELARRAGCPARFVGFQGDAGPWQLASDIAVVPSHVEPLGLVAMEAMSRALPVVGCEVGGIPQMVVHEQTGLLVPPRSPGDLAAALARLIGDAALRTRLGQGGRTRCQERFSIEGHVRAVVREYDRVVRRERSPWAS
jgi:glycosyltransferase involved in cell wall biosynthesis